MRRPSVLCVVGLLFVMACQPTMRLVKPLPPLHVSLTADQSTGVLGLSTTLRCVASGADGNYTYAWSMPACDGPQCAVLLKTIGNHTISCDVSSHNSTMSASIILEVTKRDKPITAVYVFGDSLSYGHGLADPANESWPALYVRSFKDAALHNFAVTGADSRGVLGTQLSLFHNESTGAENRSGELVFVWIGANDIQHLVSPQEFRRNYGTILDELNRANFTDIILMDIPDVSRLSVTGDIEGGINSLIAQAGFNVSFDVKGISQDIINEYNDNIRAEAAARQLPVIDMFNLMKNVPDTILGSDRVHPNKEGHKFIAERVRSDVEASYPDDRLI